MKDIRLDLGGNKKQQKRSRGCHMTTGSSSETEKQRKQLLANATSLNDRAQLFCAQGDFASAEETYKKALKAYEKALGPAHPDLIVIMHKLALVCRALEKNGEAAAFYTRALVLSEENYGTSDLR